MACRAAVEITMTKIESLALESKRAAIANADQARPSHRPHACVCSVVEGFRGVVRGALRIGRRCRRS